MDKDIDNIISILNDMTDNEVSRIKVNVVDTDDSSNASFSERGYKKEYHHGRCDVGSPWAKGASFDVLE